jgi:hypothetical protein
LGSLLFARLLGRFDYRSRAHDLRGWGFYRWWGFLRWLILLLVNLRLRFNRSLRHRIHRRFGVLGHFVTPFSLDEALGTDR